MLQSLREETEGKRQMLLSPRKDNLDSLFKEVRVFKVVKTFLSDRGSESKISRLRGWGWKNDPDFRDQQALARPENPANNLVAPCG